MHSVFYIVFILVLCAVAVYLNSIDPIGFIGFILGMCFGACSAVMEFMKDAN